MASVIGAVLILTGVMVLTFRLLGRLQGVPTRRRGRGSLQLLDRVATGPRQGVVLLRVGSRVLIVGVGDGHSLLGEVEGEEKEAILADRLPAAEPPSLLLRPTALLSRLGLLLLLLLLPVTALPAQVVTAPPPATQQSVTPLAGIRPPQVAAPQAPQVDLSIGSGSEGLRLSGAVGIAVFLGALTLLPALFMLMTGFTRILIVLSFLRSAMGTQSSPPTQLLVAIAVILTGLVMQPVIRTANETALQPYLRGEIDQVQAYQAAVIPLRSFMLANTRTSELTSFLDLAGQSDAESMDEVPTMTITAAFMTSELRTAFQMGFIIFLPFLIIDLVVASVLMSMGMFMLPPVMVSLPFKLLLFVLADGWALVVRNLVTSFRLAG